MKPVTKALLAATGYSANKLNCRREIAVYPEIDKAQVEEIIKRDIIQTIADRITRDRVEWSYYIDKWNFSSVYKAGVWVFTDEEMDKMVHYLIRNIKCMEEMEDGVFRPSLS